MVWLLLIVQVPHSRYDRGMTLSFSPTDGLLLRCERSEHVVSVILDNVTLNTRSFRTALRTGFDEYISHGGSFTYNRFDAGGFTEVSSRSNHQRNIAVAQIPGRGSTAKQLYPASP
jgi:hypothetical protein